MTTPAMAKVAFNIADLGGNDVTKVEWLVEVNAENGRIEYASHGWTYYANTTHIFEANGELELPVKVGANPVDFEYKLTPKVTVRNGTRGGDWREPYYFPAPAAAVTVNVTELAATSTVPASWATALTQSIEAAGQIALDAAATAQAAAQAAADLVILPLNATDGQVAAVIGTPGTASNTTLSGAIGTTVEPVIENERIVSDGKYATLLGAPLEQSPGKNLVDINAALVDRRWNGSVAWDTSYNGFTAWPKIALTPGATYTVSNARHISFLTEASAISSALAYSDDPTHATRTFTVPATGVGFVGISTTTGREHLVQLELGAVATAYQPHGVKVQRLLGKETYLDAEVSMVADAATRGGLTVYRTGTDMLLRERFDSTRDITQIIRASRADHHPSEPRVRFADVRLIAKGLAGAQIWPTPPTAVGTLIASPIDDNAPVFIGNSYVGGNHGWDAGAKVTIASHGKTTADLGSTWTDGTRTYTLLRIVDASTLLFGCPYSVDGGGIESVTKTLPAATLTHVAGATATGAVSIAGGCVLDQIRPSSHSRTSTVLLDGLPFGDGEHRGRVLTVTEAYTVYSYKALIDRAQANPGVDPFADLTALAGFARVATTYRWEGRTCIVGQTMTPLKKLAGFTTVTQMDGLVSAAGGSLKQYFPAATGTKAGVDLSTEYAVASQSGDLTLALANQSDPDDPIGRTYQWRYTSSNARDYGVLVGLLPVMDGKPAARKAHGTDAASWYVSGAVKKHYPRLIAPGTVLDTGEAVSGLAFRRYLAAEDPTEVVVSDGARSWVLIDKAAATAAPTVARIPTLQGRALTPVGSPTVVTAAGYVTPEGITYTNPAPGAYFAEAKVDSAV